MCFHIPSNLLYQEESSSIQGLLISASVVGVLVVITFGILYYSLRHHVNKELLREDVTTFHKNMLKYKYLVVQWPKYLSINSKSDRWVVLFYTTRIKAVWVRPLAYLQFILGWIVFCTTIVAFTNRFNRMNINICSVTLFLSELVGHLWYGYFNYWNPCWWCLDITSTGPALHDLARLYHGDINVDVKHNGIISSTPAWIEYLGFVVCIPLHVGSILGGSLGLGLRTVFGGCRHQRSGTNCVSRIGVLSALIGCLVYPILFISNTGVVGKVFAIILHHISLEFYDAILFHKTEKEFMKSLFFKVLVDVLIGSFDVTDNELEDNSIDNDKPLHTLRKEEQTRNDLIENANDEIKDNNDDVKVEEIRYVFVCNSGYSLTANSVASNKDDVNEVHCSDEERKIQEVVAMQEVGDVDLHVKGR